MGSDGAQNLRKTAAMVAKLEANKQKPFQLAKNTRSITMEDIVDGELEAMMAAKGMQWVWQSPQSPHKWGVHESIIKVFKDPLYKTIGKQNLTLSEFETVMRNCQAQLNSRPLFRNSESLDDMEAMTPSKLFMGKDSFTLPSAQLTEEEIQ